MTPDRAAATAIVLAGGRSSRFGGPKLAADLDGATILDHALRAVARVAGEILVAGGPSIDEPSLGGTRVRLVLDGTPFAGPLAAVEGALRVVETDVAIVVGGDMPGLIPAVLEAMLGRLAAGADIDAVMLQLDDATRRQVLPVALRVAPARAAATEAVHSGDRSLVAFLDRLRCLEVPASEWRALDPEGRTVLDIDVPGDLDRIRGREIR